MWINVTVTVIYLCTSVLLLHDAMHGVEGIWSFPGWLLSLERRFPGGHFPGWDVSRKDFVNGIIVGLMFRIEVDAEVLQNDHTAYI